MNCGFRKKQIFSMTPNHCEGLECGLFHIGMPSTTVTNSKSLANEVNVLVKHFGPKIYIFSDTPVTEVKTWQSAILYLEIQ